MTSFEFEEFHNLIIDDDAIEDAVALSSRYVTGSISS